MDVKRVSIPAIALAAVLLIALGIACFGNSPDDSQIDEGVKPLLPAPEKTIKDYYTAFNNKDCEAVANYEIPGGALSGNRTHEETVQACNEMMRHDIPFFAVMIDNVDTQQSDSGETTARIDYELAFMGQGYNSTHRDTATLKLQSGHWKIDDIEDASSGKKAMI